MNLRFAGQYFDEETGTHYNQQRDYAPGLGRYVQRDPIGLSGGINVYGYGYGNPLAYADPDGLVPTVLLSCATPQFGPLCLAVGVAIVNACKTTWDATKDWTFSDGGGDDGDYEKRPPNSKPIDQTEWSENHNEIKGGSGAGPADNVRITPSGEVWVQRPGGRWENTGNASDMIGGDSAEGKRGRDRGPPWKRRR